MYVAALHFTQLLFAKTAGELGVRAHMSEIKTEHLKVANGFKVVLKDVITEIDLLNWKESFLEKVENLVIENYCILLDSNSHNFESIECMKLLRDILIELTAAAKPLKTVAFVRALQYGPTKITSRSEAYFNSCKEALEWLQIAKS